MVNWDRRYLVSFFERVILDLQKETRKVIEYDLNQKRNVSRKLSEADCIGHITKTWQEHGNGVSIGGW